LGPIFYFPDSWAPFRRLPPRRVACGAQPVPTRRITLLPGPGPAAHNHRGSLVSSILSYLINHAPARRLRARRFHTTTPGRYSIGLGRAGLLPPRSAIPLRYTSPFVASIAQDFHLHRLRALIVDRVRRVSKGPTIQPPRPTFTISRPDAVMGVLVIPCFGAESLSRSASSSTSSGIRTGEHWWKTRLGLASAFSTQPSSCSACFRKSSFLSQAVKQLRELAGPDRRLRRNRRHQSSRSTHKCPVTGRVRGCWCRASS